MAEPEIESRQNREESSQLGAKAETDDQTISEAIKESIRDAEDSTAHQDKASNEANGNGRMLVIVGEDQNHSPSKYESQPFE